MLKINRIMKPFLVSYLCISISLVLFMVPFTLITQSKINAHNTGGRFSCVDKIR